ncbi:MAG TPA: site-2 protease family protein [Verrucomicrobiae bacterium]
MSVDQNQHEYAQREYAPDGRPIEPTLGQKIKKLFAPIGVALLVCLKFLAKFKFLLPFLKTGATMLISIWAYALAWGWRFAVGFVLLIFVHECGHLIAAKWCNLKVTTPAFIPFVGALITLKEQPQNAWIEAVVGIGGPILGSVGAAVCVGIYYVTGNPLFLALAYTGFFLNLFNLMPVGFLDGGRVVTALSPWLWIVGFIILVGYTVSQIYTGHLNFLLVILIVLSLPRLFSLFRHRTEAEQRYYEVAPARRVIMAVMYFGLIALLVLGMEFTHISQDAL